MSQKTRWDRMRAGNRIEWVIVFVSLLSCSLLSFLIAMEFWGDAASIALFSALSVGLVPTISVPVYALLVYRRRTEPPPLEGSLGGETTGIHKLTSRLRLYSLLTTLTAASATVQASLAPDQRPIGESTLSVFLWNFGILALLLVYLEFQKSRGKQNPRVR